MRLQKKNNPISLALHTSVCSRSLNFFPVYLLHHLMHGLRTPNEGINQRKLKIWADVADKNASATPKNLDVGVDFWLCSEGD